MKKVFKILFSLVMCFTLVLGISSCNLTETDTKDLYSKTIATAKSDKHEMTFSREELENAFTNFGYSYYQQTGDLAQSLKQTIKGLIQKKLVIGEIQKIQEIEDRMDDDDVQKEIRYEVFKSIQSTLNSYEEQIKKEWKIEEDSTGKDEDEAESKIQPVEYTNYESKFVCDANGKIIVENGKVQLKVDGVKFDSEGIDVPENFVQTVNPDIENLSNEAWVRYISNLQNTAKNKGLATDEQSVFNKKLEELTELYQQNMYFEFYENYFMKRMQINLDIVLEYFKDNYLSEYALFNDNYDAFLKSINETTDYTYFNINKGEDSAILVNHILFKFDASLQDELDIYNEQKKNKELSEEDYKKEIEKLAKQIKFEYDYEIDWDKLEYKKDAEGNYIELKTRESKYVTEIFDLIKKAVNRKSSVEEKAKEFNRLICMFSEDTGSVNAKFSYAVSISDREGENSWVQSFTDASIEMFESDSYNKGSIYSSLVASEHGYHIMFYNDIAQNIVELEGLNSITVEDLCSKYIDASKQISLFEYIYDSLDPDSSKYDNHTSSLVEALMAGMEIVYYEDNYADLINN